MDYIGNLEWDLVTLAYNFKNLQKLATGKLVSASSEK